MASVMGLMIEEMRQRRRKLLGNVGGIDDRAIGEALAKRGFVQVEDPIPDSLVLGLPRSPQ